MNGTGLACLSVTGAPTKHTAHCIYVRSAVFQSEKNVHILLSVTIGFADAQINVFTEKMFFSESITTRPVLSLCALSSQRWWDAYRWSSATNCLTVGCPCGAWTTGFWLAILYRSLLLMRYSIAKMPSLTVTNDMHAWSERPPITSYRRFSWQFNYHEI